MARTKLFVGVKTDPVESRYSYAWLFRLMADEGVRYAQLGTFSEMFQLPDEYFVDLRDSAESFDISIDSLFTTHRDLGGFMRDEIGWEDVTRRRYERLIEIGSLVGARSVGGAIGAVLRDQMDFKSRGIQRYLKNMKPLMHLAHRLGVGWLTAEPMSCLAEPPTLPDEMDSMAADLADYHTRHRDQTASFGYCVDIAHGYADAQGVIRYDHAALFQAALPNTYEVHLKNTDSLYNKTFGFTPNELEQGIIQVEEFRDKLLDAQDVLPIEQIVGYLEISGPKLGRDYSDHELENQLRQSLQYLQRSFATAH